MNENAHSAECAAIVKRLAATKGIEVNASDWRPGMAMPSGYEPLSMRCPHGVLIHMEPTIEQRLAWARDGVA